VSGTLHHFFFSQYRRRSLLDCCPSIGPVLLYELTFCTLRAQANQTSLVLPATHRRLQFLSTDCMKVWTGDWAGLACVPAAPSYRQARRASGGILCSCACLTCGSTGTSGVLARPPLLRCSLEVSKPEATGTGRRCRLGGQWHSNGLGLRHRRWLGSIPGTSSTLRTGRAATPAQRVRSIRKRPASRRESAAHSTPRPRHYLRGRYGRRRLRGFSGTSSDRRIASTLH
jgi:hypothetical protein